MDSTNAQFDLGAKTRLGLHLLFQKLGFDIQAYPPPSREFLTRKYVHGRLLSEQQITLVLDVGANVGQYAKAMRSYGYRGKIISFEPLAEEYAQLSLAAQNDPPWECRQLALGSRDSIEEFNVAGNSQSSSLLPMNDCHRAAAPQSAYVGTQQVTVARLDSIASGILGTNDRIWLKLDVQGYELEVLRGATSSLSQVEVVECELSLVPLYEGQPLISHMLEYFESLNFSPVFLENGYCDPQSRRVLQVESIFVRNP